MKRRSRKPSRAVWVGAPVGAALAIVAAEIAKRCGVLITPELAGALTTLCTFAVSYLTPGGREGESQ